MEDNSKMTLRGKKRSLIFKKEGRKWEASMESSFDGKSFRLSVPIYFMSLLKHPAWFIRNTFRRDSYKGYSALLGFLIRNSNTADFTVSIINHIGCSHLNCFSL